MTAARTRYLVPLLFVVAGCGGGGGKVALKNDSSGQVTVWFRRPGVGGHLPTWEKVAGVRPGDSADLDLGRLEAGQNVRIQVDAGPLQTMAVGKSGSGGCGRGPSYSVQIGGDRRVNLVES